MLGGIACGIRKRILIFNTHENLLHDPISVVDPNHYDASIEADDETPVVVAYNNYHYENLHTIDDQDRTETIKLAESYIKDRYYKEYGFTKKDMKYLISPSISNTMNESRTSKAKGCDKNITQKKPKKQDITEKQVAEEIDQEVITEEYEVKYKEKQTPHLESAWV